MVLRKLLVPIVVTLVGATFAAPAVGSPTVVDQYTEQIPGPGGPVPGSEAPDFGSSPQTGPRGDDLTAQSEDGSGDGSVTVSPGAEPEPAGGAATGESLGEATGSPSNQAAVEGKTGPNMAAGGQSGSESSGSGFGTFFPLALLLVVALIGSAALLRRRSGPSAHAG